MSDTKPAPQEGTPWYEHVWETDEAKRKFEAGELGYRDARKLDRELVTNPKNLADGASAVEAPAAEPPAPPTAGPGPGDPGFPDPRQAPDGPGFWSGVYNLAGKLNPFSHDWREGLKPRPEKGSLAEAPKAAAEAPPEDLMTSSEAQAAAADAKADLVAKSTERTTTKTSGTGASRGGAAAEPFAFPELAADKTGETPIEMELADGRRLMATPTQMQALLATEKAKEISAKLEEYRKTEDSARSAAMWAEIIRGVAAVSMAQYGMKHGVNMAAFQLQPIDWTAQQRERRQGMESGVAASTETYKTYEDAAKAAVTGQAEANRAANDKSWKVYQSQVDRHNAARQAARDLDEKRLSEQEITLKALELKLRTQQALAKSDEPTYLEKHHLNELTKNLDKAGEAEADGKPDKAAFHMQAAHGAAVELGQTRPDLAGSPEQWETKADPGFLTSLMDSVYGRKSTSQTEVTPSATQYLKGRYAPRQ